VTYERLRASSSTAIGRVVETFNDDALMEFLPEDHSTTRRRPHADANALLAFMSEASVRSIEAGSSTQSSSRSPRALSTALPEGSRSRCEVARIERRDGKRAVMVFLCGVAVGALVVLLLIARANITTDSGDFVTALFPFARN